MAMISLLLKTGAVFNVFETPKDMAKDGIDWPNTRKGASIDRNGVFHEGRERKTGKIDTQNPRFH